MRRLVPHDEGDLVRIARICDQRHREGDHRPARAVERLEGIGRQAGIVGDADPEIAIRGAGLLPADVFDDRLHPVAHRDEGVDGLLRRQHRAGIAIDLRLRQRHRGRFLRHGRDAARKAEKGGGKRGKGFHVLLRVRGPCGRLARQDSGGTCLPEEGARGFTPLCAPTGGSA